MSKLSILFLLLLSLLMVIGYVVGQIEKESNIEISRTTYDWGKHTGTTNNDKNSRTTYDWSKHTRTTYDWGKHTRTSTESSTTTTDHHDHHHDDDDNHNRFRCGPGKYTCAGTVGLCIDLRQICDTKIDCPHADDEDPKVCHFHQPPHRKIENANRFRGTGFQFQIRNLQIDKRSNVKLFNQDSDNHSGHKNIKYKTWESLD